jgi:hypothetical protein
VHVGLVPSSTQRPASFSNWNMCLVDSAVDFERPDQFANENPSRFTRNPVSTEIVCTCEGFELADAGRP